MSTTAGGRYKRIAVVSTTSVFLISMISACDDSDPTQPPRASYECTDAGQRDSRALAVALGAPSPTTKAFNLCQSKWQISGVRVDPFLVHATLGEAETLASERFNCGTPVHPPNMSPETAASLDCTIADVHVTVSLTNEGRRISASIHPRQ